MVLFIKVSGLTCKTFVFATHATFTFHILFDSCIQLFERKKKHLFSFKSIKNNLEQFKRAVKKVFPSERKKYLFKSQTVSVLFIH